MRKVNLKMFWIRVMPKNRTIFVYDGFAKRSNESGRIPQLREGGAAAGGRAPLSVRMKVFYCHFTKADVKLTFAPLILPSTPHVSMNVIQYKESL